VHEIYSHWCVDDILITVGMFASNVSLISMAVSCCRTLCSPTYQLNKTVARMLRYNEGTHSRYPKPVLQLIFRIAAQDPRCNLTFVLGLRRVCKWTSHDPVLRDAMWRAQGSKHAMAAWHMMEGERNPYRYLRQARVSYTIGCMLRFVQFKIPPDPVNGRTLSLVRPSVDAENEKLTICFIHWAHCRCSAFHVKTWDDYYKLNPDICLRLELLK
jgi:hypothetical protein